jgi:prepilin-type N-terminal cleavage/methylation domain-containing protein
MQSTHRSDRNESAFTLVELLVVIGIIALLISILIPTLNGVRNSAKGVQCMSNLRQIGIAMSMYARDNEGIFHPTPPNMGNWYRKVPAGSRVFYRLPGPNDGDAYWGIAYIQYFTKIDFRRYFDEPARSWDEIDAATGAARKTFFCPSTKLMDPDAGFTDIEDPYLASYGLNAQLGGRRKINKIKQPSNVIVAQDHVEHKLDGGDTLVPGGSPTATLVQWRMGHPQAAGNWNGANSGFVFAAAIDEVFRHGANKSINHSLYLDGHVGKIERGKRGTLLEGAQPAGAYSGIWE